MHAMIFCAGLGTRFKPWTDRHPKALALVNGQSLLQRNVEYLRESGIDDIIVNVHHFPDQIIEAIEQNKGWGSYITISDERKTVLETGGGLLHAKEFFPMGDDFLCINVDILCDLDLKALIRQHKQQRSFVTLALTSRPTSRCFTFDDNNRLTGWRNKSTGEERIVIDAAVAIEKAFSGISVFSYDFFDYLEHTGKFSLVDAWLALARDHVINGFDHTGSKWVDVGRPESVTVAEQLFP